MGGATLLFAWLLSVAPLVFPPSGSPALFGVGRAALCLLPWIALAGAPFARRAMAGGWVVPLAIAAPPLALATALDSGLDRTGALETLGWGLVFVGLLAGAATSPGRRRGSYGPLWLVLVPGLPAVAGLHFGGGSAAAAWWGAVAGVSPLAWCLERAAPGAGPGTIPWGPLAVAGALFVVARVGPAPEQAGEHG